MHLKTATITLLALATSFSSAHKNQVNLHNGTNCGGSNVLAYIDPGTDHCFALGGKSFSGLSAECNDGCRLTTWSGNNCGGSSAVFDACGYGTQCHNIPFGSVELSCSS
jgi:hypothetical protein